MDFVEVANNEKLDYLDLLLTADEQKDMILKYLYRGKMFALYDHDLKAVSVITKEDDEIFEIKNIAVVPKYYKLGYGTKIMEHILNFYKDLGSVIYVGTGSSKQTLSFYTKCEFTYSHVVKNFFIDNYNLPIFEEGKQLIDMIYLKRNL
ncbi:GNAT family N-acetyltransferase [Miniphocaeibacter massiliensis]|uniref:GNAT family N-acetyltransferase n=1 Tax=Miniphocaeibacter massiliensis TaxID=2041841 RepID=UPI0013EDD429|nr:GNAT family N-acetyltransferase [Miniphocaeibacter massiliensis]